MKIALFKDLRFDHESPSSEGLERSTEYVRVSEYADIQFVRLAPEQVVGKQLEAIDAAEAELNSKYVEKLSELNQKRQELRALTFQAQDIV